MRSRAKSRRVAVALAFLGAIAPGLHKFYLGQPRWGIAYLLLSWWSPIPKFASVMEGLWYLSQRPDEFNQAFNLGLAEAASPMASGAPGLDVAQVEAIAEAVRQLDALREEGLVSEYEFE
ncbi:MAG TPA: TM2 domain-containing protein, partial [Chroococcidiopsis sp.]